MPHEMLALTNSCNCHHICKPTTALPAHLRIQGDIQGAAA